MNKRSLLCFLCLWLLLVSCKEQPVYKKHRSVYKIGDDAAWATKGLDDQTWKKKLAWVPDGQIYWTRTKIDILSAPEPLSLYGLQLEVYGEYELYWDGVLIGKNGNPGQEAELGPEGKLWVTFSIPAELTEKGEHILAIRSSLYFFANHIGIYDLKIDHYDDLLTDRLIESSYIHIFAGAFLIASMYFLFLFLSNKKDYTVLVFSISCFLFFTLTMIQFIGITVPIHYRQHHQRLSVISALTFGISFLVPLYFSMQFPFPKRKLILAVCGSILLVMFMLKNHSFNLTTYGMASSMWLFTTSIVVFGVYKRLNGARLVLLILLLCVLIRFIAPYNLSLFVGFSLILLSMLYLLSLRIKDQRLAYENSLVQSTRLRLELLKKNIQPHFLMNTLTSLMDWVEEAPKQGALFIEALAKEFDLFNQIENETLIPITQEIALCRTHLEIMAYRREVNYLWEEEGIDEEQKIPPAILHTLLENGITHSLPREDNSIMFKLVFESNEHYKCYTFLTFANSVKNGGTNRKEGTGLKYIKARLTESYQSNWDFISEPAQHGWKNILIIYH